MMEWLLAEMSRARGDVGRRMREKILDILNDCELYRYLGKGFTFRSADGLDDSVNERLIELVDGIMEDVESRTRRLPRKPEWRMRMMRLWHMPKVLSMVGTLCHVLTGMPLH